jgi:hypothetical protein
MMRIRPISTTVTLLMAAIVLAAPLVANLFLGQPHDAHAAAPMPIQPSASMLVSRPDG